MRVHVWSWQNDSTLSLSTISAFVVAANDLSRMGPFLGSSTIGAVILRNEVL